MSYLEKSLGPGEKLQYVARIHWIVFMIPVVLAVLGLSLASANLATGLFFVALGVLAFVRAYIHKATTDLAVTDRKVIAKWGLISRKSIEQRLATIDSVRVDQGLLGRLLNYGSVSVTGSGISMTPIRGIADPLSFRHAVQAAEYSNGKAQH